MKNCCTLNSRARNRYNSEPISDMQELCSRNRCEFPRSLWRNAKPDLSALDKCCKVLRNPDPFSFAILYNGSLSRCKRSKERIAECSIYAPKMFRLVSLPAVVPLLLVSSSTTATSFRHCGADSLRHTLRLNSLCVLPPLHFYTTTG